MKILGQLSKKVVKEFIDLDMGELAHESEKEKTHFSIGLIRGFYNKQFKPEMITECFEGWEETKEHHYKLNHNRIHFTYIAMCISTTKRGYFIPIPKTLSQFITFCLSAEIQLKWIGK